jgi:transposase InsO family protein
MPRGKRYFFLLVDDASCYMLLVLLAIKDEALAVFIAFQVRAEAEARRKLGMLRTDRGGEFMARCFFEHCVEQGVHRDLTAPYSLEQNGVVERRNQSVMEMARSQGHEHAKQVLGGGGAHGCLHSKLVTYTKH